MRFPRSFLAGLVSLAFVPVGCDESGPSEVDLRVTVSALAPCPEPENGNQQLPLNSDRVVVQLTEGPLSISAPIVFTIDTDDPDPTGKVAIDDIPEGSGLRLDAVACQGGEATWGGSTFGVQVVAGAETPVELFMTPLNAVTCVGRANQALKTGESSSMPEGHTFAAVAPVTGGAIVLGGFSDYDQDSRKLVATASVAIYNAARSTFSAIGSLQSPRAMAGTLVLDSGSVLVVGGTSQMSLKVLKQPPLSVVAEHAPLHAIEVFDPTGPDKTTDVVNCFRFPNLPSLGILDGNQVLVVGGVGTMKNDTSQATADAECVAVVDGDWSSDAWVVALPSVTPVERPSATVARPRYGATVVVGGLQSPQRALIWGGNIDGDAGIADWFEPAHQSCAAPDASAAEAPSCPVGTVCNSNALCVDDPSDPGRSRPQILNLVGTSSHGSSLFASGIFINETVGGFYQFLILGGTDVSEGADGPEFSVTADTSRAELVTVDPVALTFESAPVDVGDLTHDVRRAAATLVPLGVVGLAGVPGAAAQDLWLLGGFTSFTAEEEACPGTDVCLQEDMQRFRMFVNESDTYALERLSSLSLTVGSFGAQPTLLRDGSWLIVGGMENVATSAQNQDVISTDGALVRYGIEQAGLCELPQVP